MFEGILAQLLASQDAAPSQPARRYECPERMHLVEGVHYDQVQRLCLDFKQDHCFAFAEGFVGRENRATPVAVCMDELEWPNRPGELPVVMLRFTEAEEQCRSVGKRLCTEYEWEMACEGPNALPWPYGYRMDPNACNSTKPYRTVSEARLASNDARVRDAETKRLWQGEPVGSRPECKSPFGVMDLVGNVEEWVRTSRPEWAFPSALKGGYWSKPWAGCRGTNDSHGPMFRFYEVGFRCCSDPKAV